jgi:hypothetical protein
MVCLAHKSPDRSVRSTTPGKQPSNTCERRSDSHNSHNSHNSRNSRNSRNSHNDPVAGHRCFRLPPTVFDAGAGWGSRSRWPAPWGWSSRRDSDGRRPAERGKLFERSAAERVLAPLPSRRPTPRGSPGAAGGCGTQRSGPRPAAPSRTPRPAAPSRTTRPSRPSQTRPPQVRPPPRTPAIAPQRCTTVANRAPVRRSGWRTGSPSHPARILQIVSASLVFMLVYPSVANGLNLVASPRSHS